MTRTFGSCWVNVMFVESRVEYVHVCSPSPIMAPVGEAEACGLEKDYGPSFICGTPHSAQAA